MGTLNPYNISIMAKIQMKNAIAELDGDEIKEVSFEGGCNGNLKGIGALVRGMKIDDAIERLEGIRCGFKPTSCPDQLAQALKEAKAEINK